MDQLQTALINALFTILVALVGFATTKIVSFLDSKGLPQKIENKRYLVSIAVNAIEQIYKNEEGDVKLEKAKKMILKLFSDSGLKITETELEAFIEESVKAMNDAYNSTKQGVIEIRKEDE